jgi:uncharacterized glyoxalase superfamily protein PhnB
MPAITNIVFYANDPTALAHFWSDVFGYPHMAFEGELRDQLLASGLTDADLASRALAEDPTGEGPRFFFHHADSAKTGRNRVHIDVQVKKGERATPDELDAEKNRLVALGATVGRLVEQNWGPWPERYYQMHDPEGNEFCLQGKIRGPPIRQHVNYRIVGRIGLRFLPTCGSVADSFRRPKG